MSETICFFGATGGITNTVLTHAIKSKSYRTIALVRTPEKLKQQLITQQGLDESTLSGNLTIVQGNAIELADVKRALLANVTAGIDNSLPSMIITGLGGAPRIQFDIFRPLQFLTLDNPTICGAAAETVIQALKEIYSEQPALSAAKPSITFVSAVGVSRGPEDVPFSIRFLYHRLLTFPLIDKRNMENVYRDQSEGVFSSVTGIRPTLLTGSGVLSDAVGLSKIRAGVENKPVLGFTIKRADVGAFIFENVVKQSDGPKWRGEMISLTS